MKRLDATQLGHLFDALHALGYRVVGPTLRDGAILYDELDSERDLPRGWTDRQAPGHYRVARRDDEAYFGYVVGPHSFKKFLFPPRHRLWRADIGGGKLEVAPDSGPDSPRYACLGVRSCELEAIRVQDRVLMDRDNPDPVYAARREQALLIAVQCTQAASTCFCTSMDAGPRSRSGFDLGMTEVLSAAEHYFVLERGSERGDQVLASLRERAATRDATPPELTAAADAESQAVTQISRHLDTQGLRAKLQAVPEHPHWQEIAERCLSCANCTMVCPTCFCNTVEDVTDLSGDHVERWRRLDSCFTQDFSYIHGGSVRTGTAAKYRQWMTHKLSSWWDQFGTSGCVGCGRCIAWCPAGIDITEEARKF